LTKLVELNNVSNKDFLTGADEAQAFLNKEYVKLHFSTLRKVDILADLAERADQGKLRTLATCKDFWPYYPQAVGEWFKEHWLASLILGIASILGLLFAIIQLF
jgi:hypothetical protein